MKKAVYINTKNNTLFTSDGEGDNAKLCTVYTPFIIKTDKNGRVYFVMDVEKKTSEKGNEYFTMCTDRYANK